MNDEPTNPEPLAAGAEATVPAEPVAVTEPTLESAGPAEPVTAPVAPASPWLAAGAPNPSSAQPSAPVPPTAPPAAPPAAAAPNGGDPSRRGGGMGWRQLVVVAVVSALVGGGVAAAVSEATKDDNTGTTKTVVVGNTAKPVANTSVIGKAKDVQAVLSKVDGAVVAIQVGSAVDQGLFSGNGSGNGSGGAGTGFVISPDGVIVTNNHVVADANGRIEVEFPDGTKQAAELLGRAPEYDLAVIKVDGKNLKYVKLGNSDAIQVGDQVVAVGNALALQGGLSVTQGIISGKGRVVPEDETGQVLYDMLQTDAAINPGNSGGPLLNANGEVIGINTALAGDSQNVGFAISIDSAKSVIESLRAGKSVRVAFLGVETSDVTPAIAKSLSLNTKTGAVVRNVTKGAAAADAGLKTNDVIIAIGGRSVNGPQDVGAEIRRYAPGDTVAVTVERGGQDTTVQVKLGARPDSVG